MESLEDSTASSRIENSESARALLTILGTELATLVDKMEPPSSDISLPSDTPPSSNLSLPIDIPLARPGNSHTGLSFAVSSLSNGNILDTHHLTETEYDSYDDLYLAIFFNDNVVIPEKKRELMQDVFRY
jgi:hypothetical protein